MCEAPATCGGSAASQAPLTSLYNLLQSSPDPATLSPRPLTTQGIDIAGSLARRSIDNSALSRQVAPAGGVPENYLAAAAAALASGQAVGSLGAAGVQVPATGSLPSQSFMSAAAALAARAGSGQPSSPTVTDDDRGLSLEQ